MQSGYSLVGVKCEEHVCVCMYRCEESGSV